MATTNTSVRALFMAGALFCSTASLAQEVTLHSSDGAMNMTGTLKSFEDNTYILATELGDLRVNGEGLLCTGAACPSDASVGIDPDVLVGGSDTVGLGLMPLVLEGYAGAIGAVAIVEPTGTQDQILASLTADEGLGAELGSIMVTSTTSGAGFRELLAKNVEVAMSSRRINLDEARALRADGAGNMVSTDQEHIIAVDSLILVVNPENGVDALSTDQVRAIFGGQVTNWSEVGGNDLAIAVGTRPAGSGTRTVFEDRIFDGQAAVIASNAVELATNSDTAEFVSANEGAIAYVGYAFQRDAKAITLISECGIAVEPDAFSAKTEEYPLQRRLYLYTREDTASETAHELVDFATSAEADTLIGKAGFIGFAVKRREQPLDGPRARMLLNPEVNQYEASIMRQMLGQMVDFDRLSTTLRFSTGSARLDARGVIDKERLISYLATRPANTEIMVVGFTDDVGEFEGNLGLSQARAAIVAGELRLAGGEALNDIVISSVGFGELVPTGCNTNEEGRRINRRVEIWIKDPA